MLTCVSIPQITHPPKRYIDLANTLVEDFLKGSTKESPNADMYTTGYGERQHIRHGVLTETVKQCSVSLGVEFEEWSKDYIHPHPFEAGATVSVGNGFIHGPHVDFRRRYNMVYVLNTGGDNVRTVWYRERGCPIERLHAAGPEGKSYWVKDYSHLEVIDDVVLEPGIWYLLNTKIIHSVENITGNRSMLTVSLPDMNQFPWRNRTPAVLN
jgi:hypothetical protein